MYAVIKTGGKQYRVQAGDLLVVEKLDGEPGAKIDFDQVLMIGEGAAVTLGEPVVDGALVNATLVETRKGKKIKVFKKIRRQGYRRTRGHRQLESVLRVTGIAGAGKSETWEGEIDLTPLAVLNARARNLARGMEAALAKAGADKTAPAKPAKAKAAKPAVAKAKPSKAKVETPSVKAQAPAKPAAKAKAPEAPAKPKVETKSVEASAKPPAKTKKADAPVKPPAKDKAKAKAAEKPAKPAKAAPDKAAPKKAAAKKTPAKKTAAKSNDKA